MSGFCPFCENITDQKLIQKERELNIRGEKVVVAIELVHCNECNNEFEKPRNNFDPLDVAYTIYRERKGMFQPEEITEIRKDYGLTQKEFSLLLGIGIATLNRYENGSLQTEGHDRIIRLYTNPSNLLQALINKENAFEKKRFEEIFQQINEINQKSKTLLHGAIEKFGSYQPDINSGNEPLNIEKFFSAIKYFCFEKQVFKTKLLKLLFYSDFVYFKKHSRSITGMRYVHATHGPVPEKFDTWLTALSEWLDDIEVQEQVFGNYIGETYYSTDSDWSIFEPSELACLATVNDYFKDFTATQIREFSHEEDGWKNTTNGQTISYGFAKTLKI